LLQQAKAKALLSRKKKTHTVWLKPTRLLLTSECKRYKSTQILKAIPLLKSSGWFFVCSLPGLKGLPHIASRICHPAIAREIKPLFFAYYCGIHMHKKEVTIYDLARELSLSTATISRSLQDHPAVSKITKQKVLKKAKELGYRYNTFAGSLRLQRTNTIGFLVHEVNSHFITSVLSGIEKITTQAGYDLLIAHSSESVDKEIANADNFFNKRVDGLIASLTFETKNLDHFKQFNDKGIPLIFFDRADELNTNNTAVIIDNFKCGYKATSHLLEQGCRHIGIVTSNLSRNVYGERHRGYRRALADHKIEYDEKMLIVNDLSEEAAIDTAHRILKMNPMPDGLFITSDFSAAVCMQVLKEAGYRIPEDIAIVGFNNDAISKLVEPRLTTIDYPGRELGEIVARNLIEQLNGADVLQKTNTIIVKSDLIVRQSSLRKEGTRIQGHGRTSHGNTEDR
jgi:LacI family transcriptional regulator